MQSVLYVLLFFMAAVILLLLVNRPQYVSVDAPLPAIYSGNGFSHELFEGLLGRYVDTDGKVDYAAWHTSASSLKQLDGYLAAVGQISPDSSPERFASSNDELAYWMYGYNAYVIKSALSHWPIKSVTDISAPIEAVKGLGFFYRQRFQFGGEYLSLLAVENKKIRDRYRDARIHFVLSCASGSCPVMRPELPTGDALEEFLATATTSFASDPRNMSIDHPARQVILSTIFKWFRKDFENELRKMGLPSNAGLIAYIRSIAPEPLATELAAAGDYEIIFRDYDWSINSTE